MWKGKYLYRFPDMLRVVCHINQRHGKIAPGLQHRHQADNS